MEAKETELEKLRTQMERVLEKRQSVEAFLKPLADIHQREYVRAYEAIVKTLRHARTMEEAGILLQETSWNGLDGLVYLNDNSIDVINKYVAEHFPDLRPEDIERNVSKRKSLLPEGWEWRHYDDGSGALKAPDGSHYFQYELATREFMLSMEHQEWCYREDLSLNQFVRYAEDEVLEKLEKEKYLQEKPEQEYRGKSNYIHAKKARR